MRKRIVFINQATGYLAIDIINAFAGKFDEVAFIYGDIRVQDTEPAPGTKRSKIIEKSRRSNLARLLRWLIATVQIFFLLITRYRNFEIFYFSVPPFAYLSSLFLKRKFSILMLDVYPDALRLAGIKESNIIFRIWGRINKHLFTRAHRIFTIGEYQSTLMKRYAPDIKIDVINLWAGIHDAGPVEKDANPFIAKHGLEGKFVVEYSGNMGGTRNAEVLFALAELLADEPDIMFLFIGRGTKMQQLHNSINSKGLSNVIMLPFQPDNIIKYSLAAADLNVVLVEEGAGSVSVPSKIYNLLALGSPVLAITPPESEVHKLIEAYKVGRSFQAHELEEICSFIKEMRDSGELLNQFRMNSLKAAENFTSGNANKFIDSYISER